MIIKTWRDPYDAGFSPTKPREIELNTGVTVLVGCNGVGKTTLLLNIQEHCKNNKIPCHLYNNLSDGGSNAISSLIWDNNYGGSAYLMTASEGESIKYNVSRDSCLYKDFFQTGFFNNQKNRLANIFRSEEEKTKTITTKDRVLLFDAVDSGLSVDSIVEIKEMFDTILKDATTFDINIYIVIAANEYELARNSECFDVNNGKYITFSDYEDYRSFIINTRKNKEKRLEKQEIWRTKQKEKEIKKYIELKNKSELKRQALLEKYGDKKLSWSEKYKLEEISDNLKDFIRSCRFLDESEAEELWLKTKE